jgi:hypothetical protein
MAAGRTLGVGLYPNEGEGFLIGKILEGSPAEQAGLRVRDHIVRLDNEDVLLWNLETFCFKILQLPFGSFLITVVRGAKKIQVDKVFSFPEPLKVENGCISMCAMPSKEEMKEIRERSRNSPPAYRNADGTPLIDSRGNECPPRGSALFAFESDYWEAVSDGHEEDYRKAGFNPKNYTLRIRERLNES